jgi:hypothetical protein
MRLKAIETLDRILGWTLTEEQRSHPAKDPLRGEVFHLSDPSIEEFIKTYSYFSSEHPLIATVTKDPADISIAIGLLEAIDRAIKQPVMRQRATAEALSKVIAFRELPLGTEIPVPTTNAKGEPTVVTYVVERIFDLWKEIPAFGLVPKRRGVFPAILLFRGTDLTLTTKRSWASILSDFDVKGPGFSLFQHSRVQLREWFKQVGKVRVMGFSLGGTLAEYVSIYEADAISQEPSYAFNPPGVSKDVYQAWKDLKRKPPLKICITQGDLIPRVGQLFSDVFEFCPQKPPRPIEAHVMLATLQSQYSVLPIKLPK